MSRDYYTVLGVPRSASAEELRAAYRRQVKLTHPDVSGANTTHQFQQLQEAWGVLSDPVQRREYDARRKRARPIHEVTPPFPAKGLAPMPGARPRRRQIHFGLQMNAREACSGGPLTVPLRIDVPCGFCQGFGSWFGFTCRACDGSGVAEYLPTVTLEIPAGLTDQRVLAFPLDGVGLPDGELILHVQIL
jgi:molecular chaperone DnaJ